MEFMQRAEVRRLETSVQKRWRSRQGGFVVTQIVSNFGLPTRYLSIRTSSQGEEIIGRHRSKRQAIKKCEEKARKLC